MKILNINIEGVRDYFQTYLEIIRNWTKMSKKEASVFATLLELKHWSESDSRDYKSLLTDENIEYLLGIHEIKKGNLYVILSSLNKKGVLKDGEISAPYYIKYEDDGGIIFSLKKKIHEG